MKKLHGIRLKGSMNDDPFVLIIHFNEVITVSETFKTQVMMGALDKNSNINKIVWELGEFLDEHSKG